MCYVTTITFNNIIYYKNSIILILDLESREKEDSEASHVINIDIQDNHEEATIGAFMICDLCTMVSCVFYDCEDDLCTVLCYLFYGCVGHRCDTCTRVVQW